MNNISDYINSFINIILDNLLVIQIVSFLISSVLLGLIIFFISKTEVFSEPISHLFNVLGKANNFKTRILRGWKEITKRLKSNKPDDLKLAVVEADKILDDILRMAGYPGENLDKRLELMESGQFSNLEELKRAHGYRNRIDSDPNFVISIDETISIIGAYKKAFQELNLIE